MILMGLNLIGFSDLEKMQSEDLLLRNRYNDVKDRLSDILKRSSREFVNRENDLIYYAFASLDEAHNVSVELQREFDLLNIGKKDEKKIPILIILHEIGDIDISNLENEELSAALNMQKNMLQSFEPGEILLSEPVKHALGETVNCVPKTSVQIEEEGENLQFYTVDWQNGSIPEPEPPIVPDEEKQESDDAGEEILESQSIDEESSGIGMGIPDLEKLDFSSSDNDAYMEDEELEEKPETEGEIRDEHQVPESDDLSFDHLETDESSGLSEEMDSGEISDPIIPLEEKKEDEPDSQTIEPLKISVSEDTDGRGEAVDSVSKIESMDLNNFQPELSESESDHYDPEIEEPLKYLEETDEYDEEPTSGSALKKGFIILLLIGVLACVVVYFTMGKEIFVNGYSSAQKLIAQYSPFSKDGSQVADNSSSQGSLKSQIPTYPPPLRKRTPSDSGRKPGTKPGSRERDQQKKIKKTPVSARDTVSTSKIPPPPAGVTTDTRTESPPSQSSVKKKTEVSKTDSLLDNKSLITSAKNALNSGNWNMAYHQLTELSKKQPDHPVLNYMMGSVAMKLGTPNRKTGKYNKKKLNEAISLFRKVIDVKANPGTSKYKIYSEYGSMGDEFNKLRITDLTKKLAKLHSWKKDYVQAFDLYKSILEQDIEDSDAIEGINNLCNKISPNLRNTLTRKYTQLFETEAHNLKPHQKDAIGFILYALMNIGV